MFPSCELINQITINHEMKITSMESFGTICESCPYSLTNIQTATVDCSKFHVEAFTDLQNLIYREVQSPPIWSNGLRYSEG